VVGGGVGWGIGEHLVEPESIVPIRDLMALLHTRHNPSCWEKEVHGVV